FLGEHSVAITVLEEGSLSEEDFAAVRAERRRYERALRGFVREGIRDGSIVACDPKAAVLAMLGAISWTQRWYRANGAWSREQARTLFGDLLERMVGSEPAPRLQTAGRRRGKSGACAARRDAAGGDSAASCSIEHLLK